MSDPRDHELHDWLEAEAAEDADRADLAFASVFARHVPPLGPATPVWEDRAFRQALAGPHRTWLAAAAALLLTVGGLAAAAFWSAWVFDLVGIAGSMGPRVLAGVAAVGRHLFAFIHDAWLPALAVGQALGVAAATGPAAAAIAINLTIAFAAALGLSRLLSPAEE
jgi:hypothetical protein